MARHCARPVILPLSNPTHLAVAAPADLWRWTGGRALVATGSPFQPVQNREVGQCNNCFLFPGLGYAAVATGLVSITDAMIDAGLRALALRIPASSNPDTALMPPLSDAPEVARDVAKAVAMAGVDAGLCRLARTRTEALHRLDEAKWQPTYQRIRAIPS